MFFPLQKSCDGRTVDAAQIYSWNWNYAHCRSQDLCAMRQYADLDKDLNSNPNEHLHSFVMSCGELIIFANAGAATNADEKFNKKGYRSQYYSLRWLYILKRSRGAGRLPQKKNISKPLASLELGTVLRAPYRKQISSACCWAASCWQQSVAWSSSLPHPQDAIYL